MSSHKTKRKSESITPSQRPTKKHRRIPPEPVRLTANVPGDATIDGDSPITKVAAKSSGKMLSMNMQGANNYYWKEYLKEGLGYSSEDSAALLESVSGVDWDRDRKVVVYGKRFKLKRWTKYFGDVPFQYSNTTHAATPREQWPTQIRRLVESISAHFGIQFDSVLLNYYRDGSISIGAHSDDETCIKPGSPIVAVSLGATRKMRFRRRAATRAAAIDLNVVSGSMYVMDGGCQQNYTHESPVQTGIKEPRWSLTLRQMKDSGADTV